MSAGYFVEFDPVFDQRGLER